MIHPRHNELTIHKAFVLDGTQFYGVEPEQITTFGRWREIQEAIASFKVFRMTPEAWIESLDNLKKATTEHGIDSMTKAYTHNQELTSLFIAQAKSRQSLFADENFTYHLAALCFFTIEDDITIGLDEPDLIQRIQLIKKKPAHELASIQPLMSVLVSLGFSKDFIQTHSSVKKHQAIAKAQSLFWMEKAGLSNGNKPATKT